MINFVYLSFFAVGISCLAAIDGRKESFSTTYLTISGQIQFINASSTQSALGNRLFVQLRDLSSRSARSRVIAENSVHTVIFPILFNISYNPFFAIRGHIYVIDVKIVNPQNMTTFRSDRLIAVNLLDPDRTSSIDVPVICVHNDEPHSMHHGREWPHLVGMKGTEALAIIKKDTGFEHILLVTDKSEIPKDLRYDRVFIFVDENGRVKRVPSVG